MHMSLWSNKMFIFMFVYDIVLEISKCLTVRSHRTRRERQRGRKSFIFNVSRRRAPARAARFGRWERRGELKSGQLYGNELWRGWAATNQNVEVLRLRGFQRTQPVNFGSDHISSQTKWRKGEVNNSCGGFPGHIWRAPNATTWSSILMWIW